MGKDSTNNVLFALGAIGSLLVVIVFAFNLYSLLFAVPSVPILEWVTILALILVAIAIIGISRETGRKIPLIAVILLLILQLLVILLEFNILFPLLLTFLDAATANLYLSWIFWIFYLIIFLVIGFSIWITRDEIGIIATITGIIFMIWSVLYLIIGFLGYESPLPIWTQLRFAGLIIVYLLAFIYFVQALRK
ncbi:MAG: hypothetical protein ACFE9D_10015 [Promethearchaeota archaeon]